MNDTIQITQTDLNHLEKYLDALWSKVGMDMAFSKHFLDRVNDARNGKQITISEVSKLFTETYKKFGETFAKLGNRHKDIEGVLSDIKTNVNSPFAIKWNRDKKEFILLGQSVMRKKNFVPNKPSEKKYTVEGTMFGNVSQDLLDSVNKIGKRTQAEMLVKEMVLEEFGVLSEKGLERTKRDEFDSILSEAISNLTENDVNELSKETLNSYVSKASKDAYSQKTKGDMNMHNKRWNGITKAIDKRDNGKYNYKNLKTIPKTKKVDEQDSPKVNDVTGAETTMNSVHKWDQRTAETIPNQTPLAQKVQNNLKMESNIDELSQNTLKSYAHKASRNGLENAINGNKLKSDQRNKGFVKAIGKIKEEEEVSENITEQLTLDEKKKDQKWGSATGFQIRMRAIDKAIKHSKKNTLKDMRKQKLKESGVFSTSDTPNDEDGTNPIEELSKKTLGSYVNKAGNDQFYNGQRNNITYAKKRQSGIKTAVKKLTKEDVNEVYFVQFAPSQYHRQNLKECANEAEAIKYKKLIESQGFKADILVKALNEGSEFFGVDPVYMNMADSFAKKKSFSPNALANDGDPAIIPGDGVTFDDNVKSMNYWNNAPLSSQLAARLEASSQFQEAIDPNKKINELSKKTLTSYAHKATNDLDYHSYGAGFKTGSAKNSEEGKFSAKDNLKSANRNMGLHRAIKKLTKEDRIQEAKKLLNDKIIKLKDGDAVNTDPKTINNPTNKKEQ